MKRKLFITLTLALFAVGAVTTTNVAQNDVSLDDIRVMAMADHTTPTAPGGQEGGGTTANACCPIWDVEIEITFIGTTIRCKTGGSYKCNDCECPN
ncbi:MAG: hypothetical protein PHX54_10375 [Lentimicrobiaceae bacterium]|nr:hypothetical protein [Lentimicrobiaceae bacterium]